MKGYFCIYDCYLDSWLCDGGVWRDHHQTEIVTVESEFEMVSFPVGDKVELGVHPRNSRSMELNTPRSAPQPYDIMTFDTMKETEDHILSLDGNKPSADSFFSIRKIYF